MYPILENYVNRCLLALNQIDVKRQNELEHLATYISNKLKNNLSVNLNFICTHNSRRSHLGQIWAATAAAYFDLKGIQTFSGGTEATAFNPRAVAAIERAGFHVVNPGGINPKYVVRFDEKAPPMSCFSKTYDDVFNPQSQFAAVMTCAEADQNCPYIPGAELRSPIRYEDPKAADDTPMESQRYDERCQQVATEMLFLMQKVKKIQSDEKQ